MNNITIGSDEEIKTINEALTFYKANLNQTINNDQFVIFLKPGIYEENFEVPLNVSIIGIDKTSVIIKPRLNFVDESQIQTNKLIKLNNKSQIKNLTISLDFFNKIKISDITYNFDEFIYVIHSQNNSNVYLENIIINDKNVKQKIENLNIKIIGLYGGYKNIVKELDIEIKKKYNSISCIYAKQTQLNMLNAYITINNKSENNYCVFLDNNTINNIQINNCLFILESHANNYGVYHYNSYSSIVSTVIKIHGENEHLYNNAIKCVSDYKNNLAKLHINDENLNINCFNVDMYNKNILILDIKNAQENDFITYGFMEGQSIKINKQFFKIIQVLEAYLVLDKPIEINFNINNEGNKIKLIKIEELISVEIINCFFETDLSLINYQLLNSEQDINQTKKNCIQTCDIQKLYKIHIHNSTLLGGNMNGCVNSQIIFNTPRIIVVGNYNSHYKLLSEAIFNIKDNYDDFVIKINPGSYEEIKEIKCRKNLTIEGYGKNVTSLKLNNTFFLNDNVILKNLTLILNTSELKTIICENKENVMFDNVNFKLDINSNPPTLFYFNKSIIKFINCCIYKNNKYEINTDNTINNTDNTINNTCIDNNNQLTETDNNLFEIHLSSCSFNNLDLDINDMNNLTNNIVNFNSDLCFNDCNFNFNLENIKSFLKHNNYYKKSFITKFNNCGIYLQCKDNNNEEDNLIEYEETNYNKNSIFINNCQLNREMFNVHEDYKINIVSYNSHLILENGTIKQLNNNGCLDKLNNLILESDSSIESNRFCSNDNDNDNDNDNVNDVNVIDKNNKNNILIGNKLKNTIIGNNNIVISNLENNELFKLDNKLIVKSLDKKKNIILGNLESNFLSINDNINRNENNQNYYEQSEENNLKLNINGSINASHYMNFKSLYPIEFEDNKHKNMAKHGMVLSCIDTFNKVELSSNTNNPSNIGVYLSIDNKDFMIVNGIVDIWILCSQNINIGDFITSSNVIGYGKKQNETNYNNFTIAKSLENVICSNITQEINFKSDIFKIKKVKCKLV